MVFNVTGIAGGKAQEMQPKSLRALLTSLTSAGSFLGVAVAGFLLIRLWPRLAILKNPRQRVFLRTQSLPLSRNPLHALRRLLQEPEATILHDCGLEAVFFLRYLWSIFLMCAFSAIVIFPSIASFTYFAGVQPETKDWLDMLSWSGLSTKDAKLYWLYTTLVPLKVVLTLYMLSRQLAQATEMRGTTAATPSSPCQKTHPRQFFVSVKNIPHVWDTSHVYEHYSRWRGHIRNVTFVQRPLRALKQVEKVVRRIEKCETLFIIKMVRLSKKMDASQFQHHLQEEISRRYSPSKDRAKSLSWPTSTSMPALYEQFAMLIRTLNSESSPPKHPRSVLLNLSDYYAARAITDHSRLPDPGRCLAQYLGSKESDIILANLPCSWSWSELSRSFIRLLMILMIGFWTLPMAAVGGLSQMATMLQITSPSSDLQIPDWFVGIIQGVAPPLATSILMSAFPILLRLMLQWAKHPTGTETQRDTLKYYFIFLIIQLVVVPSISSALIPTTFEILNKGVTELPRILAQNLPMAGNYYLCYMLTQGVFLAASTLFQFQAVIKLLWNSRIAKTPRERLDTAKDLLLPLRWGELYAFYNALAVIVVTYSLLTPLILPIAAFVFGVAHICHQYILLYLADIVVETQGVLYFPALFNIPFGLYVSQVTFIGLFILKFDSHNRGQDLAQLAVLIVTLIACTQYHLRLKRFYAPLSQQQGGWDNYLVDPAVRVDECLELPLNLRSGLGWASAGQPNRRNDVIWLPRDGLNITKSIIRETKSRFLSDSTAESRITDAYAYVTNDGQVKLHNEGGRNVQIHSRNSIW